LVPNTATFLSDLLQYLQLQCSEIVLDGADVAKAIVDFVVRNKVDKLVLGAACRNAFTRCGAKS